MPTLVPVILSGGSGSRLWPLSRDLYPKQLLSLTGEESLLQCAVRRCQAVAPDAQPIIICNEEHRFLVAEQLREIKSPAGAIVLEPLGRNTAAAIAVAALMAIDLYGEDAIILVKPSDHVVRDIPAFDAATKIAFNVACTNQLTTYGIVPSRPDTAFGYINSGEALAGHSGALQVKKFVEKPDLETAKGFLAQGGFFWNSGMFVFPARRFLTELTSFEPAINEACKEALRLSKRDLDFIRLDKEAFSKSPSKSVDYAVMERVASVAVVPLNAGWDDVGSWDALWMLTNHDEDGNVKIGDTIVIDTKDSYVRAEHRLVATVGVSNVVVVETADAVMVCAKDRVQDVKKIVEKLKKDGRGEYVSHTQVHRPWGSYETVATAPRYEVKRLVIKPGGSQSRQIHHHRAEHWVVVQGTAKVTCEGKTFLLCENESTMVRIGQEHQLENPGKIDLEVMEIRSGAYLGEDDIVRLEGEL